MQRSQRPQRCEPIRRPVLIQPVAETPPSPFMSAKDAAALLGVSPDHVTRSVAANAIPGYKWGGVYRVLREFVEDVYAEIRAGNAVVVEEFAKTWRSQPKAVAS